LGEQLRSEETVKPFNIVKGCVAFAFERVKANRGAAGVDGVEIGAFEKDLENNLFKVWNRMSSGSYFPQPVRGVDIPKSDGKGTRRLGVPTVADRVAQTVAVEYLEPILERVFLDGSYGYRPGRGALDAVAVARRRCWEFDWVIDLDIKAFFDSVDHDLMRTALDRHVPHELRWIGLYVDRWMSAAMVEPGGATVVRERGVPQGGPISPVLANLFLHYAFDVWLEREFPGVAWERYADDALIHCRTRGQAEKVWAALGERMGEVGLALHPGKTRIVYCADSNRRGGGGSGEATSFDFLGFTFRARDAENKHGQYFRSFLPAASDAAMKRMGKTVRGWKLHTLTDLSQEDIAAWIGPVIQGWIAYYGRFYPSRLMRLLNRINYYLIRWVRAKYRHLRRWDDATRAWKRVTATYPNLFPHWKIVTSTYRV
jgi:group II intron reverse transcriptase/maturase